MTQMNQYTLNDIGIKKLSAIISDFIETLNEFREGPTFAEASEEKNKAYDAKFKEIADELCKNLVGRTRLTKTQFVEMYHQAVENVANQIQADDPGHLTKAEFKELISTPTFLGKNEDFLVPMAFITAVEQQMDEQKSKKGSQRPL